MHWQYYESGKTSNLQHCCSQPVRTGPKHLKQNVPLYRSATLPQIAVDFNAGWSKSISVKTIQWNIIDISILVKSMMPRQVKNCGWMSSRGLIYQSWHECWKVWCPGKFRAYDWMSSTGLVHQSWLEWWKVWCPGKFTAVAYFLVQV